MTALLDANILIALLVEDHVHHRAAEAWESAKRTAANSKPCSKDT
jgi:predicted nucleic acid-binding protein